MQTPGLEVRKVLFYTKTNNGRLCYYEVVTMLYL
jgi:hypothetical protein